MKTMIRVIRILKCNGQLATHHAEAVVETRDGFTGAEYFSAEQAENMRRRAAGRHQEEIQATAKGLFASFPRD